MKNVQLFSVISEPFNRYKLFHCYTLILFSTSVTFQNTILVVYEINDTILNLKQKILIMTKSMFDYYTSNFLISQYFLLLISMIFVCLRDIRMLKQKPRQKNRQTRQKKHRISIIDHCSGYAFGYHYPIR